MGKKPQVHAITSVGQPLSQDVHGRAVRYLISMAIRTACVIGLFFTEGWLMWVMAAGAVFLPSIAVLMANAGTRRPEPADTLIGAPELEAPPGGRSAPRTFPPIDLEGGYLR